MAKTLAPEVVPFSSEEIGIKNLVFRTEIAVRGRADLMPKKKLKARSPVKRIEFGDRSRRIKKSVSSPLRKEQNRILGQEDNGCLPARFYRTLLINKK